MGAGAATPASGKACQTKGKKQAEYASGIDEPLQLAVHPDGGKLLVLGFQKMAYVELPKK